MPTYLQILIAIGGLFTLVIIMEVILRIILVRRKNDTYCVHVPHLKKSYRPMLGIHGTARIIRFHTNGQGIRGRAFSGDQQYRILVMGGTTAECQFIDQSATWPQILEDKLNELNVMKVWVGNIGKSGLCLREFYMQMKYLLPQYPLINMVLVLSSSNNLLRRLIEDDRYDPFFLDHYDDWRDRLIRGTFARVPHYREHFRFRPGYYDETAIGYVYRHMQYKYFQKSLYKDKMKGLLTLRKHRKNAQEYVSTLPDLTSSLAEFSHNLNAMISTAVAHSTRIVFVTQPTLWKREMPEGELGLLWTGWKGSMRRGRYYTAGALHGGMQLYNKALKNVCQKRGIECIDLDSLLDKSPSIFIDDSHFTERGCRAAAEIISLNLARKEPFVKEGV